MPNGTFQSGASDDPTASHDERCNLASHAITVVRGCRCNRNRHRCLRSTRQDAQINYLSTLSIFMKQTTYLATLPKIGPQNRGKILSLRNAQQNSSQQTGPE